MTPSSTPFEPGTADFFFCDQWRPGRPFAELASSTLPHAEMDRAFAIISAWPEYRPSPLCKLSGLATHLEIGSVVCKDESRRFGAGGVKALGAPYGLAVLLEHHRLPPDSLTAIAATDGNHGLALGWAAARAGCKVRIFVGRDVDEDRLARIRVTGAAIEIIDGTYDDAVLAAERQAESDPSILLVTDTDYEGGRIVCRAIMAGYAVLAQEAWRDGLATRPPTHVFLHCGVGGLAAGVTAGLWRRMSPRTPSVVTVEPAAAACMLASLRAGRPVSVGGSLRTRMAGLACGRPSLPAWNVLSSATRGALAITDDHAKVVQERLAAGAHGDVPLAVGNTGIAGIAGLIAAASDPQIRCRLGLDSRSRVLVINSEGPLHGGDPANTLNGER